MTEAVPADAELVMAVPAGARHTANRPARTGAKGDIPCVEVATVLPVKPGIRYINVGIFHKISSSFFLVGAMVDEW